MAGAEPTDAAAARALHCRAALLDCDAALDLSPRHAKGLFRKAQALRGLGRDDEAFDVATAALDAVSPAARGPIAAVVNELAERACGAGAADVD
jgi:hypothetical protein